MQTNTKQAQIPYAPTDAPIFYPAYDGEPMAATDFHWNELVETVRTLKAHFEDKPEVYISSDIFMYYVEGVPQQFVAPDILVTFGIGQKKRRTYKVWEEGKPPDFVMEFSSENTYRNDLEHKMELYASLRIPDYFLYDAEALYLPSPLMGFRLVRGAYVAIPTDEMGGIHSSALGLDFHVRDEGLGIYDPVAGEWVQTPEAAATALAESERTRATQEAHARQHAEVRAENAEIRAEDAETEIARLREELARLQAQTN